MVAPALVQQGAFQTWSNSPTAPALALPSASHAGNVVAVIVGYSANNGTIVPNLPTGFGVGTWFEAVSTGAQVGLETHIYWGVVTGSPTSAGVLTWSGATTCYGWAKVFEISNVGAVQDFRNRANQSGTNRTQGNLITTTADAFILAGIHSSAVAAPTSGPTNSYVSATGGAHPGTVDRADFMYFIASAAGTYNAGYTFAASATYTTESVAFVTASKAATFAATLTGGGVVVPAPQKKAKTSAFNMYRDVVLTTSGLRGYYRFSEAGTGGSLTGFIMGDETGNNSGTYSGSPSPISGAINDLTGAARFNGGSDRGIVGPGTALDVGDVVTLEAWVNRFNAAPGGNQGIISKGVGGYYMRMDGTTGQLQFLKDRQANIVASTVNIPLTGWHHVVTTKNGATVKLYLDGADVTGAVTNATLVAATGFNLAIGADNDANTYSEPFIGGIDEAAIYGRDLTANEVKAHYNAGWFSKDFTGGGVVVATAPAKKAVRVQALSGGGVVVAARTSIRARTQIMSGGGIAVAAQTSARVRTQIATGGGIVAASWASARAAAAVGTGGGVVVATRTASRLRTQAMTGGGVVVPAAVSGRLRVQAMTGGGVVVAAPSAGRLRTQVMTGGGVVVAARVRQAVRTQAMTGGGVAVVGLGLHAGMNTPVLTGGGVVIASRQKGAGAVAAATGGGVVAVSRSSTRSALGALTGGGIAATARATSRFAISAPTGGGVVASSYAKTMQIVKTGTAALSGGGVAATAQTTARAVPASSAYRGTILATAGLRAYWRLGEGSGTAAADELGGNPATYQNAPTLGVAGGVPGNTAVAFNGTNQYVDAPDGPSLDLGDVLTLEAWVSPVIALTARTIVSKGAGAYVLRINPNGGVRFLASGGGTAIALGSVLLTSPGWHHVVATKNGATSRIYIDGVDVTTAGTNVTLVDNSAALAIGADAGTNFFNGTIDEVALYDRALTAAEVAAHYAAATAVGGAQLSGGGRAVYSFSSGELRTASVSMTGGGVAVVAQATARAATAAPTGGGVATYAYQRRETRFAAAVLSGGGVVALLRSSSRAAVSTATGGGVVAHIGVHGALRTTAGTGGGIVSRNALASRAAVSAGTGGGVIVDSARKLAASTAAATGGGVVDATRSTGRAGTQVFTGGGVVVLEPAASRLRVQAMTGGGIVASTSLHAGQAVEALSGGGVVVSSRLRATTASATATGGGVAAISRTSARRGAEALSGGGIAVPTRSTARLRTQAFTGGGIAVASGAGARLRAQALTGGGVAVAARTSARFFALSEGVAGLPDGSAVSPWPNAAAGGAPGTMVGTPVPVIANGVLNGKPVVRFTVNEGRLRMTGVTGLNSAYTAAWVTRMNSALPGRILTTAYPPLNFLLGDWNYYENVGYDGAFFTPDVRIPQTTNWRKYSADADGLNVRLFRDGTFLSAGAGGQHFAESVNISGYEPTGPAETTNCDLAELIIYANKLSDANRALVEAYLDAKWFGAGSSFNPASLSPLVVWLDASQLGGVSAGNPMTGGGKVSYSYATGDLRTAFAALTGGGVVEVATHTVKPSTVRSYVVII